MALCPDILTVYPNIFQLIYRINNFCSWEHPECWKMVLALFVFGANTYAAYIKYILIAYFMLSFFISGWFTVNGKSEKK